VSHPSVRPDGGRLRVRSSLLRENDESAFTRILLDYVARVPGAVGAALVDLDGEAVDYAGRISTFDLKLAGAHWQIVLREFAALCETRGLGEPGSLSVRGSARSFIAHVLPDRYSLVLVLGRRAGFTSGTRAFAVCARALAAEAGWTLPAAPRTATWFALEVLATRGGRPAQIHEESGDHRVEILGQIAGLGPREKGWRVRLSHGPELTLVREPGDHWYADEHLASLRPPADAQLV
jgi:hypothetical protein